MEEQEKKENPTDGFAGQRMEEQGEVFLFRV